ncbi:hypothetical protein DVH05_001022 [Phytophthora capsici]|nr:hypothetical protein DVH05_001022 [Phytophthora capsici]
MAIRGTSASQDGRYFAQEKKLLAKMTFPKCFEERVDMRKVQREVINQWVTERITQLLGFEDDIVVSMAINLLEPKVDEKLDPKQLQMALTGFLEKQAGLFMEELWNLLLSAQSNPTGIPSAILDKKKQEMQRIAEEKEKLKKVLDTKRKEVAQSTKGRPEKEAANRRRSPERDSRRVERRRSRSLQRRPRSPPRRFRSPRRRSPSVRRRSRSPRKRSRSQRRRSPSPRRRSRSSPRGRSRRRRSRSPSVRRRRRSSSGSPDKRRRQRSPQRRHSRRSPSSSSSASRHRSPSSSRSRSPPRRRSSRSRRKDSSESGSGSD